MTSFKIWNNQTIKRYMDSFSKKDAYIYFLGLEPQGKPPVLLVALTANSSKKLKDL